jgi:hypothetical protein
MSPTFHRLAAAARDPPDAYAAGNHGHHVCGLLNGSASRTISYLLWSSSP